MLIYTHLLPGAASLMHFYENVLDGSSWMRTAVAVVTCRVLAVLLGKIGTGDLKLLQRMQTQGLII